MTDRHLKLVDDDTKARRVWLWIMYQGPYAKASGWLWKVDANRPEDVPDPPVSKPRDWLADKADKLDMRWRERYVRKGTLPPARWKS